MKKLILLALLLTNPLTLFSQDYIVGRLIDLDTKEPVVFASIVLKGMAKGVISNEDGSFRIPLDFKKYNDALLISSMGYETITMTLDTLRENEVNMVYLRPKIHQLQETTVTGYVSKVLAKKIVRRAIRSIPDNYPKAPFAIVGYYRDYQKDGSKYINLNESIIEIQDRGFGKKDLKTTNYKIYRFVKNHDFPRDSISSLAYNYENHSKIIENGYLSPYDGNELVILRVHDAIRNYDYGSYSFIGVMKRDLLPNHTFSMGNDVFLDGLWLYSINFETSKTNITAYGNILISKKDYAIYRLRYGIYYLNDKETTGDNRSDTRKRDVIFEVNSEYRPQRNKMYLNYLSFSNNFMTRMPPVFMLDNFVIDMDKKEIWLYFNNPLDIESTKDPTQYELYFEEKKIPLKVLFNHKNEKQVRLKPMFKTEKEERLFFGLVKNSSKELDSESIVYKIKGLKDINGNTLGYSQKKTYLQIREFFAQKTIFSGNNEGKGGLYMDKTKPIFQNNIKKITLDSINGYWMNTPLKGLP
ncbi:carboxypeptidase-like regulatory domain-containing protein [Arenibacter sp. GZD96]|uniref:carboxypeptidase-like regulatory domain-containing protein n=1 Tax=Aurantibrevibacter litoralis TaxID=3106030 RepID=UPI002AFF7011|nr:carboxypeptidase-like regulatory domain-containing protein [Arenibacter sp. GZD-96]MEA1784786.1 carboxypeptidase-like regulatory domain-containing protein [Arenibacter sp. GZD-96]